jgi:membrane protein insertase Oxa1/YidC/SpoIIIJ
MFAFGLIPLTATMPQSVFVYWATNNSISICQTLLLKNKDVKKYLEILEPPPPDPNAPPVTNPFSGFMEVIDK